jgi:1-deoxy-D-xylulose-5-phosphate synthase
MVVLALAAADALALEGISATVVDARFAAPVDETAILGLARSVGRLVTVEENVLVGGFGDAVHECLARQELSTTPILHLALPDQFVAHGKRDELLTRVGLDAPGIARAVSRWVTSHQRQYT